MASPAATSILYTSGAVMNELICVIAGGGGATGAASALSAGAAMFAATTKSEERSLSLQIMLRRDKFRGINRSIDQ